MVSQMSFLILRSNILEKESLRGPADLLNGPEIVTGPEVDAPDDLSGPGLYFGPALLNPGPEGQREKEIIGPGNLILIVPDPPLSPAIEKHTQKIEKSTQVQETTEDLVENLPEIPFNQTTGCKSEVFCIIF